MFLRKPHGNNQGSVGRMAAWWNEGKCAVVNDRTPQSLLNSSSLIWVDPHRALTGPDLLAPAPGAQCTHALQKRGCVCWEEEHDHRSKFPSSWVQRRSRDSCSQCGGVTSPVQTLSTAFGADVFKNLACSEQNRCFSVIKYTDINTHTHTRTLYKLLITHLLIKYTLRKENKFFNVCQHRSP